MKKPFLFLGGVVVLAAVFFWIYLPTLSRYRNLRTQQEQIEQEITRLDSKIQELTKEKLLLKNDVQYLEKVIREEMGLVKPGEVVYKFIQDIAKGKPAPQETTPPKQEEPTAPKSAVSLAVPPSESAAGAVASSAKKLPSQ